MSLCHHHHHLIEALSSSCPYRRPDPSRPTYRLSIHIPGVCGQSPAEGRMRSLRSRTTGRAAPLPVWLGSGGPARPAVWLHQAPVIRRVSACPFNDSTHGVRSTERDQRAKGEQRARSAREARAGSKSTAQGAGAKRDQRPE